jgi:hypothetical protein
MRMQICPWKSCEGRIQEVPDLGNPWNQGYHTEVSTSRIQRRCKAVQCTGSWKAGCNPPTPQGCSQGCTTPQTIGISAHERRIVEWKHTTPRRTVKPQQILAQPVTFFKREQGLTPRSRD